KRSAPAGSCGPGARVGLLFLPSESQRLAEPQIQHEAAGPGGIVDRNQALAGRRSQIEAAEFGLYHVCRGRSASRWRRSRVILSVAKLVFARGHIEWHARAGD